MPGIAVLLLIVTLHLGVIMLFVGLLGRRLNDHPVCKWCKFDLEGVYPESVTCPECGAGLKRDRAVRIGVRRKMPALILAGALLAATPVVPIGTIAWALLTGTNIDTYKPLGILLWEARHSDGNRVTGIATEIGDRILRQKLSSDQYQRVINETLDFQADTDRRWSEAWGDLIERARLDGVLTPEQGERFNAQAAVIELRVRPTVQASGTTPVLLKLKEARVGSSSSLVSAVRVKGVKINGKPAKWDHVVAGANPFFGDSFFKDSNAVTFTLQGSKASGGLRFFGTGGDGSGELLVEVPADAPLGPGKVELALESSTGDGGLSAGLTIINGTVRRNSTGTSSTTGDAMAASDIRVVGPRDEIVTPVTATAEKTAELANAMRPHQLTLGSGLGSGLGGFVIQMSPWGSETTSESDANAFFKIKDIKEPLAFDVICRAGGKEWKLGELHSGLQPSQNQSSPFAIKSTMTITINGKTVTNSTSSDDGREVAGSWEGGDAETVDIILRPSADVAAKTFDLDSFYGGSIEFKDVPVVRAPSAGDPFRDMDKTLRERFNRMQQIIPDSTPRQSPRRERTPAKPSGPL
jgi:hypothetical protein